MLEWLQENWELICICFGLLVNTAGLIYNVCRYLRAGCAGEATEWVAILQAARQYEVEAEQFKEYSAAEKLQYVLSRLRIFVAERGSRFDESRLTAQIEADIAFSKQVNATKGEQLD